MASNKSLLMILEEHQSFSSASQRLRALTKQHGSGALMTPSLGGYAILGSSSFVERVAESLVSHPETASPAATWNGSSQAIPQPRETTLLSSSGKSIALQRRHPQPISSRVERSRLQCMSLELSHAYRVMPAAAAQEWVGRILKRLGSNFVRRLGNIVDLSVFVLEAAGGEVIDATKATVQGRGGAHFKDRLNAARLIGAAHAQRAAESTKSVIAAFRAAPGTTGSELMVTSLGFFLVGGGLDADGGVPDMDFDIFGIGGHRSIFTHSIVAGAVVETMLFALVDFVTVSHRWLPAEHDPLWDVIESRSRVLGSRAVQGASAGLAYHLGVDSLLQPGTYKDLPFSAGIEIHQGIAGANAVAEAKEAARWSGGVAKKEEKRRPIDVAKTALGGAIALAAWLFVGS